eukprot:SAG11_NODE_8019_length_1069_cov_1.057732_1_plen_103_part_01
MTFIMQANPTRKDEAAEHWSQLSAVSGALVSFAVSLQGLRTKMCLTPRQGHWFDEYTINSQASNHIYLDLSLANLSLAIKSADRADRIEIKLARNPVPCLAFE